MTAVAGTDRPIPSTDRVKAAGDIPIHECGEPVLTVPTGNGLHVAPMYHRRGIPSAPDEIGLRQGVLDRLVEISAGLPDGMDLLLWDGVRTLQTQSDIVAAYRATLPPGLSEAEQIEEVERYLARPPASESEFRGEPPPHTSGGAIDLTLCDTAGEPLDLGAEFDEFEEIAWLSYYEQDRCRVATPADRDRARLRRLLYWSMVGAGFSSYPWEFWHFELGTQVAAATLGQRTARYGAAVPWVAAR